MQSQTINYLITGGAAFLSGGGLVKVLVYVSKNMPPIPTNAGWWKQFAYALVKGTSGLDPSSTITPPWDGKTNRRVPR